MKIIQIKFVTNVQNAKKSITLTKEVKQALNILDSTDDYNLIIEVSSAQGTKIVSTSTTSGGETKVSDFSDHVENGELVTVTVTKL
ncbi:hypothetical protein [Neisseria weixii]|uniref:hypothetical protein n=1 Tax=Neisseria weixii TaxID=1853276 RepID=UPI00359FB36C